jgi:mono/diheme cytochrome c family protein
MKPSMFLFLAVVVSLAASAGAEERHMMQPVVPADKLVEARALKSPLPDTQEIVEKGKAIYDGKGGCFNCHGTDGMDPLRRNSTRHLAISGTMDSGAIAPKGKSSGRSSMARLAPP